MITLALLKNLFPATRTPILEGLVGPLNKACGTYGITTKLRLANFLAQIGHESAGLATRIENLNYSEQALQRVFKKYFPTAALAKAYARKPEKIANRVYANRMGNGPETSGDGWLYRGRGFIQLTGKNNVTEFAKAMKMTNAQAIAYLDTPEGAAMSAAWFWYKSGLNKVADKGDIVGTTKIINGGTNGLDDRRRLFALAKQYV